jgi:hypothetical protein
MGYNLVEWNCKCLEQVIEGINDQTKTTSSLTYLPFPPENGSMARKDMCAGQQQASKLAPFGHLQRCVISSEILMAALSCRAEQMASSVAGMVSRW